MPAKIDLTGQQFGELTVIKEGPHKYGRVAWYCNCSCGKTDLLYTSNDLRMHKITSCGCKKLERIAELGKKSTHDLTGQIFGYLEVIEDSGLRGHDGSIYWTCKCKCGTIKNIIGYSLTSGDTKSCGCQKRFLCGERKVKDLTGQRFGKLVAQEKFFNDDPNLRDHTFWKCKCDCGNTKIINSRILLSGKTQSCGCLLSKGEMKIQQVLEQLNINFKSQKSFDSCRFPSGHLAKFDFYLSDYNILIEYDGQQHFEESYFFNTPLEEIQSRDNFKNHWCEENQIPLIRIPYTDFNIIDTQYLKNKINEVKDIYG